MFREMLSWLMPRMGQVGGKSGYGRLVRATRGDRGRKACWPVWWERNGQSQESFLDWRQGTASEIWGSILRQRTLEWRRPGPEDEAATVDLPSVMGCLQPDLSSLGWRHNSEQIDSDWSHAVGEII